MIIIIVTIHAHITIKHTVALLCYNCAQSPEVLCSCPTTPVHSLSTQQELMGLVLLLHYNRMTKRYEDINDEYLTVTISCTYLV